MLSESDKIFVDSQGNHEQVDSSQEITNHLIGDQSLLNSFFQSKHLWSWRIGLGFSIINWDNQILDGVEFWMIFRLWVDEIFDFSHLELSHSQKSISWGNFVSISISNHATTKR